MSNPTTPFSWQMPTATDLVTDLPADFEVFGQAVATSMGDLLGGTSGQILAKNSNTDMDFVWVANDQGDITGVTAGTGITVTSPTGPVPTVSIDTATTVDKTTSQTLTNKTLTSPVLTTPSISNINAKGDILVGTADNTLGIITAGSNGETLVADSSTSTGLRWQGDRAGAKNGLINSAFDVSQRGATITGITLDNTYTADRWYVTRGGIIDYALKTVAGGNNPPTSFDAYGQYINQSAANPFMSLLQTLETKDSIRFAGTAAATLSFWARATANTTKSKSIIASIGYNTTADTKINTLLGTTTFTTNFGTAATDWTYCTLTVGIPSTAKTVGAVFNQSPSGGLAVGDGFEVTGVQLERAAVATAFQRNAGTIQGELAACKRYLPSYDNTNSANNGFVSGYAYGTNTSIFMVPFDVAARTTPTGMTVSGTINAYALNTSTTVTPTFDAGGISSAAILASHTITAGQGARLGITTGAKLLFTGCEL